MFFQKYRQRAIYLLFFLLLTTVLPVPSSEALEKTFPLEKVKPGMKGYGYTVFSGTKIEKFDVKVLALVDSNYGNEKMILVQLSGKGIEESGGLAAGMSGSPVYLNNRLLGAIGYGFENADSSLALVTPIDVMLKLLTGGNNLGRLDNFNLKHIATMPQTTKWKDAALNQGTVSSPKVCQKNKLLAKSIPVATPVLVSGMRRRGYELISRSLEPYGLKTIFVPGLGNSNLELEKFQLKPGSAIAVLMVSGDYRVSAIGTVTMVDGKSFLAFGHSYTNKGNVDYFTYQANILHTVKSPVMSFKIGSPGKLIGRITQDRQAGILGRLEELPEVIPVQVSVRDEERNLARNSTFYVTDNELSVQELIISGVTDAIDQTIDRVGPGSAKITVNIETTDTKTDIYRENVFTGKDIAVSCLKDLRDLLEIIYANDFSDAKIKNIRINAEIKNKLVSARVGKLGMDSVKVKPGAVFKVRANLHTYRGVGFTVPFEIKLPANMKPGKMTITVYGGSRELSDVQAEDAKKAPFELDYKSAESLNDLIVNYLNNPRNNELILEYDPEINSKGDETGESKPVQLKYQTQYYLTGESQLAVEVEQP